MTELIDRYFGSMLGLAAGDALGVTLEFQSPGTFQPISDMVGGGPFQLAPGQWTDDTSMALCLAESLVECRGFDPQDQMRRYVRWYRTGYMSSRDECFDIGNTTRSALQRFEVDGDPYAGVNTPNSAGNGSLMRLAPIPLAYGQHAQNAIDRAADMSRTTHSADVAVDCCRYYSAVIIGALQGRHKEEILGDRFSPVVDYWKAFPLHPAVEEVAAGSFKGAQPPEIAGTGYALKSMEAALWAFWMTNDFRSGALMAANLGDDADTTAAVFGQLAGAYYGVEGIPEDWRAKLHNVELIESLSKRLLDLARIICE
jgi:ADP-ribosyl-[dinitrogen reductase] hydrolase